MTISDDGYFGELAERLRAAGMPQPEITATVADLAGYLAESGSPDPYEEFGTPELFADRLTREQPVERPDAAAETWTWTTDIYADRKYLNQYGDQGWELTGFDRLGRFVCRRPPQSALRWEYRRESAEAARSLDAIAAELAPDGWEPCGRWLYFMYLKRPKAATVGPAAGLDELLPPPERRIFVSRTSRARLTQMVAAAVVSGVGTTVAVHYGGTPVLVAVLAVVAVGGPLSLLNGWRRMKREVVAGTEDA